MFASDCHRGWKGFDLVLSARKGTDRIGFADNRSPLRLQRRAEPFRLLLALPHPLLQALGDKPRAQR